MCELWRVKRQFQDDDRAKSRDGEAAIRLDSSPPANPVARLLPPTRKCQCQYRREHTRLNASGRAFSGASCATTGSERDLVHRHGEAAQKSGSDQRPGPRRWRAKRKSAGAAEKRKSSAEPQTEAEGDPPAGMVPVMLPMVMAVVTGPRKSS